MPDIVMMAKMYGPSYHDAFSNPLAVDDPKEPDRVLARLASRETGTFLDYGCGRGDLLARVARLGWDTLGVEFTPELAAETARRVPSRIFDRFTLEPLLTSPVADVVHLGDVIEHLPEPNTEMPRVLRLIKPGGLLIAQGPLEAQPSMFTSALKLWKLSRGSPYAEVAPYHVVLATADGQRRFFDRFGLQCLEFTMHETAWPAPSRFRARYLTQPRGLVLFGLRRLSQMLSALSPDHWGNRYFFVGRRV